MSTSHVCAACRRNTTLSNIRRHSASQSRSRSTFVSLASSNPTARDGKATEEALAIGAASNVKHGQNRSNIGSALRGKSRGRFESRPATLEALFEDYRKVPLTSKILPNPGKQSAILALYEHIETLKVLLAKPEEPTISIWHYFVSHLSAPAWHLNTPEEIPRPLSFKAVTGTLLQRLQVERTNSRISKDLPTVTQIMSVFASLGQFKPANWKPLIYDLLRRLSDQRVDNQAGHAVETDGKCSDEYHSVSEDVLGAWKVLCQKYSLHSTRKGLEVTDLPDDWKFLSYSASSDLSQVRMRGGLDQVLLPLWPRCPWTYIGSMSAAALSTFSVITDGLTQSSTGIHSTNPFIVGVAKLLVAARCDIKDLSKSHIAEDIFVKDLNIDWPSALRRATSMVNRPAYRRLDVQHLAARPLSYGSNLVAQRLIRAVAVRDLEHINDLWAEIKASARSAAVVTGENFEKEPDYSSVPGHKASPSDPDSGNILSQELCNKFIQAFMVLGQPDRAVEVWNYMIETSRHPNLSTWHAMLEGCRKARNHTSLEAVWLRLTSSFQPDVACWRTRISGLIECGKPELAIRALDEMGRNWREFINKQRPEKKGALELKEPAKPTIETINDTVSGLLNRGHLQAGTRVLAWGDEFGIKPDIVTYNILIRGLVRDGRIDSVPSMLLQMQKQGIQADVATFTTILDEIFKTSNSLSPKEQLRLTNLVFTEMEAAGVRPNRFTYNRIISSLLQSEQKGSEAIQAVLARMAAQNIEPSRDVYTMFVKHLFSQDPPDFHGVRSILDRIRISGATMDHIFWDRVIEGYASVGDTANALALLGRIDKEGSRVGWVALDMVLRALAANDEWELARQVVRNVKIDRGGPPAIDQKGVEGQHAFWRSVGEFALMDA